MLRQLMTGAAVSAGNIAIHALIMMLVVTAARTASRKIVRPLLRLSGVMIATMLVLMAAHTFEVVVWAAVYFLVGAAPDETDLVYFAFVNYTTLGYGDSVPLPEWQLLGPMTAMNGVLLFGWSTAVIFDVLLKTRRG